MEKMVRVFSSRLSTFNELLAFLWENRMWWMIPFITTLIAVGGLVVFAQTSPVAPFMYALF